MTSTKFLSTPSARRATGSPRSSSPATTISIHALREEGDLPPRNWHTRNNIISIHALREEGDVCGRSTTGPSWRFLSTPSARRATAFQLVTGRYFTFLSTPSARRATAVTQQAVYTPVISIHALREEGDHCAIAVLAQTFQFLSTPSARRATHLAAAVANELINFYPRPPRGGRRQSGPHSPAKPKFLSTPSARRATPNAPATGATF